MYIHICVCMHIYIYICYICIYEGMDKIKNAAAMVPAILFFYFGIETIYHSFSNVFWPTAVIIKEGESSLISIAVKNI